MAKPRWYYERQAREAQAREDFFRDRIPPESATIESKGPQTDVFYRSLHLLDGTEHLIYRTSVDAATLQLLSAAQAGLLTELGDGDTAQRLRGSGVRPTRIKWYRGTSTPSRRRTDWGTSVARYYDTTGGRSHFSVPFSRATGVFNSDDLIDAFNSLFGAAGSVRNLLGTANGRATIEWERVSVSAGT